MRIIARVSSSGGGGRGGRGGDLHPQNALLPPQIVLHETLHITVFTKCHNIFLKSLHVNCMVRLYSIIIKHGRGPTNFAARLFAAFLTYSYKCQVASALVGG